MNDPRQYLRQLTKRTENNDLFALFSVPQEGMRLRRITAGDTGQLRDLYGYPLPPGKTEILLQEAERWYRERREIVLAVTDDNDLLCGVLELYDITPDAVTIGYRVMKPYRRRGYAYRALAELMRTLTERSCIRTVYAKTACTNTASAALLAKCGFEKVRDDGTISEYKCEMQSKSMVQ